MMAQPKKDPFSLLKPLHPISALVWLIIPGALLIITLAMFFAERTFLLPDQPKFTMCDSFWFTLASFTLRAIDYTPRSIAGRILGLSLWISSLLFMCCYTANMTAMLTVSRLRMPVRSLEDLILQPNIQYGTVHGSQSSTFFRKGNIPQLQTIWRTMTSSPGGLLNTSDEGFRRVSQGDYAFLWDSSRLRYHTYNSCMLQEVGEVFGIREYAFGVPKGVHYRQKISQAILNLRESGRLHEIESRQVQLFNLFNTKQKKLIKYAEDSVQNVSLACYDRYSYREVINT